MNKKILGSLFAGILCLASTSGATTNLDHVSCVYAHGEQGWQLWQISTTGNSFDLPPDEKYFLTGMWTSDKPVPPNYAICTAMVGTKDDNSVVIESSRFKAEKFNPIKPDGTCTLTGTSLELIDKKVTSVQRGSFAEATIDWLPPEADQITVKEYLPLLTELSKINEIAYDKCMELIPTTP